MYGGFLYHQGEILGYFPYKWQNNIGKPFSKRCAHLRAVSKSISKGRRENGVIRKGLPVTGSRREVQDLGFGFSGLLAPVDLSFLPKHAALTLVPSSWQGGSMLSNQACLTSQADISMDWR